MRYNLLTRWFHHIMAVGFLWMLLTAIAHKWFPDTAFESFFWPTHKLVGASLFILATIRILWTIMTFSSRPTSYSGMATFGHFILYCLMLIVPGLALLRQYGSGRELELLGFTIFEGSLTRDVEWMVQAGNMLHSNLAWLFFILIAGHIIMAIHHSRTYKFMINRIK